MILTNLPDLPPRPLTAANASFRAWFYARWGRENALVCGRATAAEYSPIAQALSIKLAMGGAECYLLPRRRLRVDDDALLILNAGTVYGSRIDGTLPADSLAVFFRPGLMAEVNAARRQTWDQQLDEPAPLPCGLGFSEHLRPRVPTLVRRLMQVRRDALAGERDEDWLEQHLLLLASDMLDSEADGLRDPMRLQVARAATRQELTRRLRRAADVIQSRFADPLTLDDLAAEACLSRFHFVRHFSRLFGISPCAALMRKRAAVAARLHAGGQTDVERLAQCCGLGSRWALRRAWQRFGGPAAAAPTPQDPHAGPGPGT